MEVPSEFTQGRCYPLVKSHLKSLVIEFPDCLDDEEAQFVLEGLQLNCYLRQIVIFGYKSNNLPRWASLEKSLRTLLVVIQLCVLRQRSLPSMRQLDHLKFLELEEMNNLEYMEESRGAGSSYDDLTFFPCLEELRLIKMSKLKEWWTPKMNIDDEVTTSSFSAFPSLCKLQIIGCPNLISFPSCPYLQLLDRFESGDSILLYSRSGHKELATDKICKYKYCKDEEFVNGLVSLVLRRSTIESVNFFKTCGSSLRYLEICNCSKLKSGEGGI